MSKLCKDKFLSLSQKKVSGGFEKPVIFPKKILSEFGNGVPIGWDDDFKFTKMLILGVCWT